MIKRDTIKKGLRFVGSFCVGTVMTLFLKQNVVPEKTYEKIAVGIGSFVLSDMISVQAETHIDGVVDRVYDTIDQFTSLKEGEQDDRSAE